MSRYRYLTLEEAEEAYFQIQEGLEIDLLSVSDKILHFDEEVFDIEILQHRLILLNRLAQHASVLQGHAKRLEKSNKTPETYGLHIGVEELNRAIRSEIESTRTILSNLRETIKIR